MITSSNTAGRPPILADDERRALILQAAERVFDQMGYGDATMEEVARACGMAKKTVYKYYADKPALFGALIDSHDVLRDSWTSGAKSSGDVGSRLDHILRDLSAFILSPRQLTLTRLVIAEARKSPELAERFYRECVKTTLEFLARELEADPARPNLAGLDATLVADMFLAATLGALQLKALMLAPDPDALKHELETRVAFVTGVMLRVLDPAKADTGS